MPYREFVKFSVIIRLYSGKLHLIQRVYFAELTCCLFFL